MVIAAQVLAFGLGFLVFPWGLLAWICYFRMEDVFHQGTKIEKFVAVAIPVIMLGLAMIVLLVGKGAVIQWGGCGTMAAFGVLMLWGVALYPKCTRPF